LLKLHQIFFRSFLIVFSISIIVSSIISYYTIKNIQADDVKDQLINNIVILKNSIDSLENISTKIKKVHKESDIRVTIIDIKGKVLAETNTDKEHMDNHILRDEIKEANYKEYGSSMRFSNTLQKNFLYVANKTTISNRVVYIRMSYSLNKLFDSFHTLWLTIILILSISMYIALIIAFRFNKKIEEEIHSIKDFLESIDSKNYTTKLDTRFSKEFVTISYLIKRLSQRLIKKAKQKRKQTAKLKLMNKQKDDIISAISHEFKNPIAVIVGYCETIQNDKDINENMRDRFLNKISVNAQKLSNMINRLRLAINLEDREYKPNLSNINIYNLTSNAIKLIQENYKNREIILYGDSVNINSDPVLMDIAITNLIENALKYSEDVVEVTVNSQEIIIKDYGSGIPKDDLEKVTNKFFTIDKNNWNNSLGLGLNIVSKILRLHKFSLHIETEEEIGSTFIIKYEQ
jgi:signal transduction histidine kinase